MLWRRWSKQMVPERLNLYVLVLILLTVTNYEFIFYIPCQTKPHKNKNARHRLPSSSQSTWSNKGPRSETVCKQKCDRWLMHHISVLGHIYICVLYTKKVVTLLRALKTTGGMSVVCAKVSLRAKTLCNDVNAANKYAFVFKVKTYSSIKERENYNLHKSQYQRDRGAELNNKTMSASDSSHWKVNNGNNLFFFFFGCQMTLTRKRKKNTVRQQSNPSVCATETHFLNWLSVSQVSGKKSSKRSEAFFCQLRPWKTVTWDKD